MISRRTRWRAVLLLVLTLGLLAAPAPAQQAGRVPKIAFVRSGPPPKGFVEAFQRGLRDLGYVEGRTMVVEYRFTDGTPAQLTDAVGELLRLKVDVMVASGLPATLAAKDMTRTVPIVFPAVVGPIETGLVTSLARPGANLTGLSLNAPDLLPKRLEALGQVVPRLSRVAVLRNPASPGSAPEALKELERGAHALGVQLDMVDARGPNDFEAAFSAAKKSQALLQLDDVLFTTHRDRLVGLALRHRLPAIYGFREHVDTGGLMSYGPNIPELYRRSATFVDKILKGAKPGELPIEQPATFELAVNLKTAKALGLTIPPSLLARADHVIQ
jgi:putative ABC transport system substrate-binding protein